MSRISATFPLENEMSFFFEREKPEQRFFNNGWGDPEKLKILASHDLQSFNLVTPQVTLKEKENLNSHWECEGSFRSAFAVDYLPQESHLSRFKILAPDENIFDHPLCLLFAMTGDQGFSYRRTHYALPLLKKGIGSVLLENPLYGARRPAYQQDYFFVSVTDMVAMALAAVEEGVTLIRWLKEQQGVPYLGVAGLSQAAMMAGAVAAVTPFPIAAVCSLVAHSPEVILCDGLLRKFVNWEALKGTTQAEIQYQLIQAFRSTDLTKLRRPAYPEATLLQGAYNDFVAPRYSVKMIHRLWPGSELRWLPGTHLTSLALHKKSFVNLIVEAFKRIESVKIP